MLRQTSVQSAGGDGQSKEGNRFNTLSLLLFDLLDRDHDHIVRERDVLELLKRFDEDLDGKVDVTEFVGGLTALIEEESRYGGLRPLVDAIV